MLKKIIFCILLLCCTQSQASPLEPKQAEQFMQGLGDQVIRLLSDQKMSADEKTKRFREILETKFHLKSIGKFVLGRYWKTATEEQKKAFLELFEATSIATYTARFQAYTSEKLEILGSRLEKDGGVVVITQIIGPNKPPIAIEWKLFQKKGEIRIYDVILEGISMGITQRSEFAAVIQQRGGDIQALINALQEKLKNPTQTEEK